MAAAEMAPLTTMASAIFFGSILFAAVALSAVAMAAGDWRALQAAKNPRAAGLDVRSFASIYTLLVHTSIFGLILLYAYLCEHHPPYAHSEKSYDRDEFFFLTALLFVVSAFTVRRHKSHAPASNTGESSVTKPISSYQLERPIAPSDEETEVMNRDQTEEWKGWMQFMFLLYHYYHAEEVYNAIRIMITCYGRLLLLLTSHETQANPIPNLHSCVLT
jgi:hypothetical protein